MIQAVFFDRDGTLIEDIPYNNDPERVRPMRGAPEALRRLREAGVKTAVISNQSGVGLGLLTLHDVARVNARVDALLGPFGRFKICPHTPDDACACRKPSPRMIVDAANDLGVALERCVFIGDIGTDVEAALAAGVRAILVPTPITLAEEVERAPEVASSLDEAVDRLLACRTGGRA